MSLLIWGAGAIGGTIGAHLARAGQDVLFVDTAADHVAAINANGLSITGPVTTFTTPARAVTPEAVRGTYSAVWLATKAQDTRAAANAIAPHLAADGHVLSLQNGLTELILKEIVGEERTLGAFINFGADYLEPGVILYGGRGACVIGELNGRITPRLEATVETLRKFEPDAIATDDIFAYLWGKLGYGALLFATALTNESIADVLAAPQHRPVLTALAREMTHLSERQGITPNGFNGYDPALFQPGADPSASFEAMVRHNAKSAKSHSGIWRDLAVRKRRTEADPLLTMPLHIAQERGIPMPLTARLVEMVGEIERGERSLAQENLSELAEGLS